MRGQLGGVSISFRTAAAQIVLRSLPPAGGTYNAAKGPSIQIGAAQVSSQRFEAWMPAVEPDGTLPNRLLRTMLTMQVLCSDRALANSAEANPVACPCERG